MAKLPEPTTYPVSEAIYAAVAARAAANGDNDHRAHLGASIVGHSCARFPWLVFRWSARWVPDGRMQRLLETGHRTEERIIEELRLAGMVVEDRDAEGKQLRVADAACGGHFGGSQDGQVTGVPGAEKTKHVLEVKTAKASIWRKIAKDGVAAAKPQHFDQMQTYMRLSKLKRALYVCVNKDTDEVYVERVAYFKERAEAIGERALEIINATSAPPKVSANPGWWECKQCAAWPLCHAFQVPEPVCRNCVHATAELDGDARWSCRLRQNGPILSEPCEAHLLLPDLVPFAEAVDADAEAGVVVYELPDGSGFVNGPARLAGYRGLPCHTSAAIAKRALPPKQQRPSRGNVAGD